MSGLFIHLFYVFGYFACMYVCELHAACLAPVEARESARFPGTLVTDGCEFPHGLLGTESGSRGRAASALNFQAVFAAPLVLIITFVFNIVPHN